MNWSGALPQVRDLVRSLSRPRDLHGLTALGDQAIVSATNFGVGVMIGRVCGTSDLGVYALAWTLVTVCNDISSTMTTTPYTVFAAGLTSERRRRYLGSLFAHQMILSTLFAVLLAGAAPAARLTSIIPGSVSSVLGTAAAAILFISTREFARRVSFADLRITEALWSDVISSAAQIAGMVVLWQFGLLTVNRAYAVMGVSSALTVTWWLTVRRADMSFTARDRALALQTNWSFSRWALGSWMLWALAMYLYPWLLTIYHGTAATGLWAASSAIVALGNPVLLGLGNHIGPRIASVLALSGATAMRRYVYRSSLLFGLLLAPLAGSLFLAGDRIVGAVYGAGYSGAVPIVVLLAANMLVSAVAFPYTRALFSMGRAKDDTLVNVAAVVLLFTVGLVAVSTYSTVGAAAALLMSTSVTAVIRHGVFARQSALAARVGLAEAGDRKSEIGGTRVGAAYQRDIVERSSR